MKDPFENWYEDRGHRFDHRGQHKIAMEIAFCHGEIVGMERTMGYAERRHNENKDKDGIVCINNTGSNGWVRGHQEQHMAD